jgi:hypothetical protein
MQVKDSWNIRPATLGLPQEIHPIWFPFAASWQSPVSGNFKYAERWRVLYETWRILSWSRMTALGWLLGECAELLDGFDRVRQMCESELNPESTVAEKNGWWRECQRLLHAELARSVCDGLRHTRSTRWEEFGLGDGSRQADQFFESLAAATIIGMLFPKWGRDWNLIGELQEVPPAKWIQDRLIPMRAR